jgi:hypothetical protein
MSVPAEVEAEWNAWYSREYVPGYRKVPGVIYARHYRVLEGTSGYSTVYEFAGTAVPESPEWKEQQQHSSPNSPRMRQAMTHAFCRAEQTRLATLSSVLASMSLVSAAPTYCRSSANPSRHPIPTTRPSAPSRRHQTRPRQLSLLSHQRWPRRHRCRPPSDRTHHHPDLALQSAHKMQILRASVASV